MNLYAGDFCLLSLEVKSNKSNILSCLFWFPFHQESEFKLLNSKFKMNFIKFQDLTYESLKHPIFLRETSENS